MIEVLVYDGERKPQAFSNPVVKWGYELSWGNRMTQRLRSYREYNTVDGAYRAGLRAKKSLMQSLKMDWR